MKKLQSGKLILAFAGIILIAFIFTFIYFKYASNKPNVILITIDALRADHLSCYGYKRYTSPNIDRLAAEGTVFLNCFAVSNATVFSSPALLTGRYLAIDKRSICLDNILDKKFTTLAEYLKDCGYYTAAFFDNDNYRTGTGFEQGFDYYRNYGNTRGDAQTITNDILNFLNDYRRNKSLFIWVHYMDVHAPYSASEELIRSFEGDELWLQNDRKLEVNPREAAGDDSSEGYIPRIVFHENKYSLNYYIACYDAGILYTDFHIGRLLKKIPDNTVVILTADHGESLGEHNVYFSHGDNIYDELLHAPLIIRDNKYFKRGKSISIAASSVDIVPTILSRINSIQYFFNKNKFNGIDLKRIVKGKDLKRRYIYSYYFGVHTIRDVDRNIKYISDGEGKEELYFLPDECNNLIEDNSKEVFSVRKELRDNLKIWLMDYPLRSDINPIEISLTEEAKQNLRSLGYLQ